MNSICQYEEYTIKACKEAADKLGISLTDLLLNKLIFTLENLQVTTINADDII